MGWLAAGCCTAIAGFILYRFLVQNHAEDCDDLDVKSQDAHATQLPVKVADDPQPTPKSTHDERFNGAPTLKVPLPLMEISQTSDGLLREMAGKPLEKTNQAPRISMPPPPPPPTLKKPTSPPRLKSPSFGASPVPPRPGNGSVRPPPSAASSLRVPITKPLPNASLAPTSSIMPPGKQVSRKVILEPGHSPLDWAALANNPNSRLRGKDAPGENLLRITPTQLKMQNGRKGKDAWTVYQGKVYNITPYVPFHPGGSGEILRGAGKDSVRLFMEVHPWVNWDGMLSECLVGILVGEGEDAEKMTGALDEMD